MLYDIDVTMDYAYDAPASHARHIVRLLPLSVPRRQRLIAGTISVTPQPDEQSQFTDFFGQSALAFLLRSPHESLDIRMIARVQVEGQPPTADLSPRLSLLSEELAAIRSLAPNSPHHFLGPSPRLPPERAIAAYGRDAAAKGLSVLEIATEVCRRIHRDFKYDATATTVDSTASEAFALKRGVCQDFAHIMIIALRSLGIPAGYVSGFLRTIPPPGKERLEGADAMHAWVRIWCGASLGWVELDPTNNIPAGPDHIVVAYGRDYSDVAPVIGVLKSYGEHRTAQAVDVVPVSQAA